MAAFNLVGDGLNQALSPQLRRLANRVVPREPLDLGPADVTRTDGAPMIEVRDLAMSYAIGPKSLRAVDGVSFALARGEGLGVVGESGCGKSSLGAALLQVLAPNARLEAGDVAIDGRPVLRGGRTTRVEGKPVIDALRWTGASIIFQSAMNALNPVMTVERQLAEAYRLHRPDATPEQARARIVEVFELIGIPASRLSAYPHELSGGMRQRVMIALSLLHSPGLVIADEPTTALDVLVQDQILGEIDALRRRMGLSLILISHDMGAVAETCDRVAVMYAGEFVEVAPTAAIFDAPRHPYTAALLSSLPTVAGPRKPLSSIPGETPSLMEPITGCRFAPRCAFARDRCREVSPPRLSDGEASEVLCHFPLGEAAP